MKVGKYAKTVVTVLIGVAVVAKAAFTDGEVTNTEIVDIVLAGLTALGVWAVPNSPQPERPANSYD